MARLTKTLEIRTSPHILSGYNVDTIMFNVVLALLPTTVFAVHVFGLSALLVLGTAVASCLLTERVACPVCSPSAWPAGSRARRPRWVTGRRPSPGCSTA
jgi:hypothetical protein